MKMNKDLIEFFQDIIYLKNKGWGLCDKPWIALFCNRSEINYFNSFGVEHVPEEFKKIIRNKNIKASIFRVQANNSVMCGYFCIGFIDFMLAGKKLIDFTGLFSSRGFDKNDHIILSYFKDE